MANRQHAVKSSLSSKESSPRRTAAGDAFSVLVMRVLRLAGRLNEAGDVLTGPFGHTSARWQVLAGAESGTATVADIARALGLARQSVQRVADVLASEGWVAWHENPAHARAKLLALTEKGQQALKRIQDAQRAWADAVGAKVGTRALTEASATLEATFAALEEP